MTISTIRIGILDYPGVMRSALHGLEEMFLLANDVSAQSASDLRFAVSVYEMSALSPAAGNKGDKLQVILVPPSIARDYGLLPNALLRRWILDHHAQGTIICSACAGAFILADAGLLHERQATTHWKLAPEFARAFPDVLLQTDKILINDGDVITAAGIMSWVDLGLEIVAQFMGAKVMRQLGKNLVVDTGLREQRYYETFSPRLDHGDPAVLKAQHYVQKNFMKPVATAELSALSHLTGRTFLRRFTKATGLKPRQYIQRLRIQKACDLIEQTNATVDTIALKVGYEDSSAFRRMFARTVGLSPRDFRARFGHKQVAG